MSDLTKHQRAALVMLAERTTEATSDPGIMCSDATFADTWNVFINWRTAQSLHRLGLVTYPYIGSGYDGDNTSVALTEAGWSQVGLPRTRSASVGLTDDEKDALWAALRRARYEEAPIPLAADYQRTHVLWALTPAVEGIVAERLREHIKRERPVIRLEGVPQALRAAALLDASTLGDAWDTIQPSIVVPPPWSYLRRFLGALADAIEPAKGAEL